MAMELTDDRSAIESRLHPIAVSLPVDDQDLIARLGDCELGELGAPDASLATDRARAHQLLVAALADRGIESIRHSPLGPTWSSDFDICGPAPAPLATLGWIPADSFYRSLGSPGSGRWFITDATDPARVLGVADFHTTIGSWPEPTGADLAERVAKRARERGSVGLREVLELRQSQRLGHRLPADEVTSAAARIEAALGGGELAHALNGSPSVRRLPIKAGSIRRTANGLKRLTRPRVVVALSGVDGAGKSSLTATLLRDFERVGLTPEIIWARPGMRMEWIEPILRLAGQARTSEPTVASVAQGHQVDAASRRGLVGWVWTMLVTGTFLTHVWWRQLRTSGLKIYDRHLDDAIVSLDFVYDGVDLRVPRWLIEHVLPRAHTTFYLSVDAATAVARKPGDTFGLHAVSRQLEAYTDRLDGRSDVTMIDATSDSGRIASEVFATIVGGDR